MRLLHISIVAIMAGASVGCNYVEEVRNTGLAQCEAFVLETLKSPSSYERISFTVVDTAVSKEVLADSLGGDAIGDALAGIATNPGIRGIALDYDSQNGFGAIVRGGSACYFPLSNIDAGEPASDWDSLARQAASRFQLATLSDEFSFDGVCCLDPSFDTARIHKNEAVE